MLLCSTHNTHTALALDALAAGKHVYSEKPLAMTLDEARRLQQAVHESGLQLMSGWWFKHSPVTKRLREVIPQPYFILFTCRLASSRYDNARPNDPEGPYGRNGILDAAGYNLHWIWHVMRSQPVEVTATGYEGAPTNTSTITIRFANGGIGTSIYSVVGAGGILPKHYAEVLAGEVSAATLRFAISSSKARMSRASSTTPTTTASMKRWACSHTCACTVVPAPWTAWEACIPDADLREGRRVDADPPAGAG